MDIQPRPTILALLIDAARQSVRTVEIEPTLEAFYAAIGCHMIEAVRIEGLDGDVVYVDEVALLTPPPDPVFWTLSAGQHDPILGNALIVGGDGDGGDTDVTANRDQIALSITFARALMRVGDQVVYARTCDDGWVINVPGHGFRAVGVQRRRTRA